MLPARDRAPHSRHRAFDQHPVRSAAAERFLAEFNRGMRRVQRFPLSGSRLPENPDCEMRQIIVWKNYRVFYFVEPARGAIWF